MRKILHAEMVLLSPDGKNSAPIQITYDDNDVTPNPASEILLLYNGQEYRGSGTDYLWTDTFADLERKLPNGVKLACCMTCRHGSMCPYGNTENLLFCTKDLTITGKEDLCDLFDQTDPFQGRSVASFDCCHDFAYQSHDHFTYNDFLYQLNQKSQEGTPCGTASP